MNRSLLWCAGLLVLSLAAGCAKPIEDLPAPMAIKKAKSTAPPLDAGTPIAYDNKSIFVEANAKNFVARTDPFALNASQQAFEKSQNNERLTQQLGGFYPAEEGPEQEDVAPVIEPQPYRRLAGVVVAQSVIGIIELNGEQQLIRPGQLIPGTQWRVVSIDADKAVLRREGNTLPHEITVRLESRPFGTGPANNQGGTGSGSGPRIPPGTNGRPGPGGTGGAGSAD